MDDRREGGFARTVCACKVCRRNCKHVSGMISPADLTRWQADHGDQFAAWADDHLAASPGALVMKDGQVFRIPTLVPRRLPSGRCHWLTPMERCAVHTTAPYGCAVFDCRMSAAEGDQRSQYVLAAICADWFQEGPYRQIWERLEARGQTVRPPEEARQRMNKGRRR